jgi:hypothetical protein
MIGSTSEQLADIRATLDYYCPKLGHGMRGVDDAARVLLDLAESQRASAEVVDAVIVLVGEWVSGVARQVEEDREMAAWHEEEERKREAGEGAA